MEGEKLGGYKGKDRGNGRGEEHSGFEIFLGEAESR